MGRTSGRPNICTSGSAPERRTVDVLRALPLDRRHAGHQVDVNQRRTCLALDWQCRCKRNRPGHPIVVAFIETLKGLVRRFVVGTS